MEGRNTSITFILGYVIRLIVMLVMLYCMFLIWGSVICNTGNVFNESSGLYTAVY